MQIIYQDFKKGKVKLRIDDADDLWYLSHLIDPGDLVKGRTTRKIKIGEGDNAKVVKKTLTLKIEAETIEFGAGAASLRINGKIKQGSEEIPRESYHAISLEKDSEFVLEKERWLTYQKQKLEDAAEGKQQYLLCIFDREEALFALTKKFGYEILATIKGNVPKKTKTVEVKQDFQQEIIKALERYNDRYNPENIIVASPAFYKEDLVKKIKSPEFKMKIVAASCSSVNERALDEVIRKPQLVNLLKNSRAREEQLLVEELLHEINKDNLAAYGWEKVISAVSAGAVRMLLLTDTFIQRKKESGDYLKLDEYMKQVDTLKGNIHIISALHEAGRKLDGLGGIAALLRYKMEW